MLLIVLFCSRFHQVRRVFRVALAVMRALFVSALVALLMAGLAHGAGCGVPIAAPTAAAAADMCTDWQCSRALATPGVGNATSYHCVRGLPEGSPCQGDHDCYKGLACDTTHHNCTTATTAQVAWKGYVAIGVAVVAFGSNFIPARKFETGNGLFFQFIMSIAIMIVGFGVQMVRKNVYFYPYAMLGGMLWCIGNTKAVPVIRMIGMGLGVTLWGTTNMLMGWASGKFGIWGLEKEVVKITWLSYVGVAVGGVSIIVLALIQPKSSAKRNAVDETDMTAQDYVESRDSNNFAGYGDLGADPFLSVDREKKRTFNDVLGRNGTRAAGVVMALAAGCLFGLNFDPPQLLMDQYSERSLTDVAKYSPDGLDYVFSHFFGIFVTASSLLTISSFFESVVAPPSLFPDVDHAKLIFPAFLSGLGWAAGEVSWFIANTNLGLVVSFPMVTLGPGIVSCLWGVLLFGEIRGARNLSLLGLAFVLIGISAACTVLAKQGV